MWGMVRNDENTVNALNEFIEIMDFFHHVGRCGDFSRVHGSSEDDIIRAAMEANRKRGNVLNGEKKVTRSTKKAQITELWKMVNGFNPVDYEMLVNAKVKIEGGTPIAHPAHYEMLRSAMRGESRVYKPSGELVTFELKSSTPSGGLVTVPESSAPSGKHVRFGGIDYRLFNRFVSAASVSASGGAGTTAAVCATASTTAVSSTAFARRSLGIGPDPEAVAALVRKKYAAAAAALARET